MLIIRIKMRIRMSIYHLEMVFGAVAVVAAIATDSDVNGAFGK